MVFNIHAAYTGFYEYITESATSKVKRERCYRSFSIFLIQIITFKLFTETFLCVLTHSCFSVELSQQHMCSNMT